MRALIAFLVMLYTQVDKVSLNPGKSKKSQKQVPADHKTQTTGQKVATPTKPSTQSSATPTSTSATKQTQPSSKTPQQADEVVH